MLCRTSVVFFPKNLMTKTTIVSLFALSLLALTGVGYAAFTYPITVTGTASAGTLSIAFANPANTAGYGTSTPSTAGACSFSGTGSSTTLTVSNMVPGDTCTADITISNTGTVPTSSETTAVSGGPYCNSIGQLNCFYITDNLGLNSETGATGSGGSVGVGGSFTYTVTVGFPSLSTLQSTTAAFTITVTASAGS